MYHLSRKASAERIQKKAEGYCTENIDWKQETQKLKKRICSQKVLEKKTLEDAFALCSAAVEKTLGMKAYLEQIMGGLAMAEGGIAEMKTGEGKTLAGVLPLFVQALYGKGAFCVTANEYLARRDYEQMKPVFTLLGLSVSLVKSGMSLSERKYAYSCDIVYGTHSEFGFDYLRDNMAKSLQGQVQRGLYYAQVDEADSILLDEAGTPLIVSAPGTGGVSLYRYALRFVRSLDEADIEISRKEKRAVLTESGVEKAEAFFKIACYTDPSNLRIVHAVEAVLYAEKILEKDVDYLVKDSEIILIDSFTGRKMPGRRFSSGLHQALEAKEGVSVRPPSKTLASISVQNFFRLFEKRSGMTGTAAEAADELWEMYQMPVVCIPTHKPSVRIDLPDRLFKDHSCRNQAAAEEVIRAGKKGQPVLIGTLSVEQSEELSELFSEFGIEHRLLNARQDKEEAQIIMQAGRSGAVTIATNMAGRGTDIRLDRRAAEAGGLYVIGTQRCASSRIDEQLRGRSGRQGDPGKSIFLVSADDPLMQFEKRINNLQESPEEEIQVTHRVQRLMDKARMRAKAAEREKRKNTFIYDTVLDKQRREFYASRQEVLKKASIDEILYHALEKAAEKAKEENFSPEVLKIWGIEDAGAILKSPDPKKEFMCICAHRLKREQEILGRSNMQAFARRTLLDTMDEYWQDHLDMMDMLRKGIGLRSYGQKDPVQEYIRDGAELYRGMIEKTGYETVRRFLAVKDIIFSAGEKGKNKKTA